MANKRKSVKKRNPNQLTVDSKADEDEAVAKARTVLRPNVQAAITLTNNGTETDYGQSLLDRCDATCFPAKRIRFINGDGEPTGAPLQGQMICYFGPDRDRFKKCFQIRGRVLYDAH